MKHEAAERVARQVEVDLADTMNQTNGEADIENVRAFEIIAETFKPDPNKAFIDSKLHDWIREQAAKPDGMSKIRDAAQSDKDVATVLFGSKPFLLGINADGLENLKADAVLAHAPEAVVLLDNTKIIRKTASNYPQIFVR